MDFMLEEELIDLYTFCLQNPDSPEVEQKKVRITEVGKEIFDDGGVDALENFYFAISNRIQGENRRILHHFAHYGMTFLTNGNTSQIKNMQVFRRYNAERTFIGHN